MGVFLVCEFLSQLAGVHIEPFINEEVGSIWHKSPCKGCGDSAVQSFDALFVDDHAVTLFEVEEFISIGLDSGADSIQRVDQDVAEHAGQARKESHRGWTEVLFPCS